MDDEKPGAASVETALLKLQVAALERSLLAFAIALARAQVLPLRELLTALGTMQLNTRWKDGEDTAGAMQYVIDVLRALQPMPDPLHPLLQESLLYAQAGDEKREPLQAWLAQATESEIAEDLLEAWRALLAQSSGSAGGGDSRGD